MKKRDKIDQSIEIKELKKIELESDKWVNYA
jgi:hypothetical protein